MSVPKPEEQRRIFERLANVREIVFGIQDGVLTTAGVVAGLSGAVSGRSQIILAALASTAAGALSMAAGAYLGTRAETEVIRGELRRARQQSEEQPYLVQENLLEALAKEGLSREAGYRVVKLLSEAPQVLRSTAEEKIYGLSGASFGKPIVDGLLMGVAFLAGAVVPLLPFVLIASVRTGLIVGMATTALVLFGVGYVIEGRLGEQPYPSLAGARFLAIAMGAAAAGYLIGLAIAPIGGVPAP
ncbi:MAG TPA: VIT1/CCC1 transporter family protein [Candidatus Binataceae bacterium]|nr:VIT1/CCC1 transporter family protein [Candidatus Binataceae bacterium]